uniref:Ribonuclease H protein At1g65750 family n=1 Tax=Cajanus cajan TaxID=3821 RepID=A0A151UEQ3_CAJCA
MKKKLSQFCAASRLKINTQKSKFICSKGIRSDKKTTLANTLGINSSISLGKYLGHNLITWRVLSSWDFKHVVNKARNKMASWKRKLLNHAGRSCLTKFILTTTPIYSMQAYQLPQAICEKLNQAAYSFLWSSTYNSRGWSLDHWDQVIKPKMHRGLGERDA